MIAGITKVRNESLIIQDTLDHFGEICDAIYVYDDASTDDTPDICKAHPAVERVIRGVLWDKNRFAAERFNRQAALTAANEDRPEWIVCFDADERFELPDFDKSKYDAVRMKLFDFYITEEDVHLKYTERRWLGPEFRTINMMYRNGPSIAFTVPDQREMRLPAGYRTLNAGFVKHYGKAITVEQWEETCDYYAEWFPEPYKTKWANRRGKAIHTESDFGRPLITWEQKETHGVLML